MPMMKSSQCRADFDAKRSGGFINRPEKHTAATRQNKDQGQTNRLRSVNDSISRALSEKERQKDIVYISKDKIEVAQDNRLSPAEKCEIAQLSETDTQISRSTAVLTDVSLITRNPQNVALRTESVARVPKVRMSREELKETRRKAAVRLAGKRRELKLLSLHESDAQRYECTLQRVKWRANTKGKRTQELDRQVDKFILRDVILNNPQALAFADQHDFDCVTGRFDESVWGDLLTGLELPSNDIEWEIDGEAHFPRISEHILNSVGLASATKMIQRSKFDNDDDSVVRTSVARLFAQKTRSLPIASKASVDYDKASTMRPIQSIEDTEQNLSSLERLTTKSAEDILAGQRARCAALFSPGMMQMQDSSEVDGQLSRSSTVNEPKKRLNLFSKFIPPDRKRGSFEDRGLLGDGRSFNSPPGVGSSSDDNSCNSEGTYTVRLADSVFLVGPGDDEIEALIQQYLLDCSDQYVGGSTASRTNSIVRASEKERTIFFPSAPTAGTSTEHNLEPKLLYLSHKDPEVEEEVLPFFCYPSGVNVTVGQTPSSPRGRSPKASIIPIIELAIQNEKNASSSSSIGSTRCFTFLLANNTSNQFGVCLLLPRIFKDIIRGVTVSCDYCVCIVTKLPFLSYFFNLLLQFETQGGFDFSEPVKKYSTGIDNFMTFQPSFQPPALRLLIEFTRHLRDIRVPLYRLGIKSHNRNGNRNGNKNRHRNGYRNESRNGNGNGSFDDMDNSSHDDEDEEKSSYQPITFSMALRSITPRGSFSQLLDAMNASPTITASTSQFVSGTGSQPRSNNGKGYLMRRFLYGIFRRDLMGVYSALPLIPINSNKSIVPSGSTPDPPHLPSNRWPVDDSLLGLLEEEREKEVCFHTLLWALPALLRHLPLDQIILAIGCALTEMRVVVVGEDLGVVSGCVLALVNLLRPLKWAGPVIVTLPSSLHAYLESPVPLILGMQSLPDGFKLGPGIIMIDPKERVVHLYQTDVVVSHTLILPKANKLMHSLRDSGEIILRLTRKRNGNVSSPVNGPLSVTNRKNGSITGTGTGSSNLTSPLAGLRYSLPGPIVTEHSQCNPLPIEIDVESVNGKKLMAAVCGFSAIMAAHLETIVNTAVQISLEEKRNRRKCREEALLSRSVLKEAAQRCSSVLTAPVSMSIGVNNSVKPQGGGVISNQGRGTTEGDNRVMMISESYSERSISPPLGIDGTDRERDKDREQRNAAKGATKVLSSAISLATHDQRNTHSLLQQHRISAQTQPDPNLHFHPQGDYLSHSHSNGILAARERMPTIVRSSSPTPTSALSSPRMGTREGLGPMSDSDSEMGSSGDDMRSRASTMTGMGSTYTEPMIPDSKSTAIFSKRDLGEGGVRFLRRVRESQMFCNYCHTQSLQRKALRVQVESLLTRAKECLDTGSTADNVGVGDVYNINKGENEIKNSARGPNSWNGGRYSFTGPGIGTGTRQSSQHSEKITTISEEDEEDSLVSLFKIILTGTIPLKRNKIDLLLATYRIDEARLKQNYDGKTPTPVATTMISATSSASSSFTTGTPQSNKGDRGGSSFNNGTTRDIHIVRREKERTIEDEIVWCNGRCNGAANGPLCSAICMNLWAERVQQARKTISVKRAIARQHHSDLVMNDVVLPWGDRISIRPRALIVKHKRETQSQYLLRLREALGFPSTADNKLHPNSDGERESSLRFDATHFKRILRHFHPTKSVNQNQRDSTVTGVKPYSSEWCGDTQIVHSNGAFKGTPYVSHSYAPHTYSSSGNVSQIHNSNGNVPYVDASDADIPQNYSSGGYAVQSLNDVTNDVGGDGDRFSDFFLGDLFPLGEEDRSSTFQFENSEVRKKSAPTPRLLRSLFSDSLTASNAYTKPSEKIVFSKYAGNTANSATRSIAQHYMLRDREKRGRNILHALTVLAPFLLSCVRWRRSRAQNSAAVMIQSTVRGYYIRRDTFHLVHFLRFRKALRMLACLFIRNWARRCSYYVYCRREMMRMMVIRQTMMAPMSLPLTSVSDSRPEFSPNVRSGSRINTSRTERTDISAITNIDENRVTAPWKSSLSLSGAVTPDYRLETRRDTDFSFCTVGRERELEEVQGNRFSPVPSSAQRSRIPFPDSKGDRSPASASGASPSGRRFSSPLVPSLSGSPFHDITPSQTDPNLHSQTPSIPSSGEKPVNSPMRKLSIHRAIDMLGGFLRRGAKEHRASSASMDTGKDSTGSQVNRRKREPLEPQFDLKSHSINYHDHTPLASSTPPIYAHSLDFHNITESQQLLQDALSKAAKAQFDLEAEDSLSGAQDRAEGFCSGTPRSSAAISDVNEGEGVEDDIGPLVPFDPLMSRYSSLSDMSHTNNHTHYGTNQFVNNNNSNNNNNNNSNNNNNNYNNNLYCSSVFESTLDTHDTLPPRPPTISTVRGGGNFDPSSPEIKTWFPQFDSLDPVLESQNKHREMASWAGFGVADDLKISKQSSSFAGISPDRPVHRRNCNSLSSVISINSATPSPERYTTGGEKVSNRFYVGKSGFENKDDRKIPIFMRRAFKPLDEFEKSTEIPELYGSDYSDTEMKVLTLDERRPPVTSVLTDCLTNNNNNSNSNSNNNSHSADKRNVSFSDPTDAVPCGHFCGKISYTDLRSLGVEVPRSREGSPIPHRLGEGRIYGSKVSPPIPSCLNTLPIVPPTLSVRVEQICNISPTPSQLLSISPSHSPIPSRNDAIPICGNRTRTPVVLTPGSRPSVLTIPGPVQRSQSVGIPCNDINSSRSRANSDASENYDMILGVENNFSLDNYDSRKPQEDLVGQDDSRLWEDESVENSPNKPSSSYDVRKNKPTSVIIRSLGSAAKESITPLQLNILMRMRELLRTGVEVLKHGRGGRPKRRTLYCESDFTKLFWRKLADKSPDADPPPPAFQVQPHSKKKGSILRRLFGPENGSKIGMGFSRAGWMKADKDRTLQLRDIVEVRDDIGTDVMRRSLSKHFVTGSEDTCVVSIVLMKRTLDFEIEERFWRPIFHALQILVNYYRVILPSMQSQRSIDDGRGLGLSS